MWIFDIIVSIVAIPPNVIVPDWILQVQCIHSLFVFGSIQSYYQSIQSTIEGIRVQIDEVDHKPEISRECWWSRWIIIPIIPKNTIGY